MAKLHNCSVGGHVHYCPGCDEMHRIPDNWTFEGDFEKPTFAPSVLIRRTLGPLARELYGKEPGLQVCHYFLREGVLEYLPDCTHKLAGQNVPLPDVPDDHLDSVFIEGNH